MKVCTLTQNLLAMKIHLFLQHMQVWVFSYMQHFILLPFNSKGLLLLQNMKYRVSTSISFSVTLEKNYVRCSCGRIRCRCSRLASQIWLLFSLQLYIFSLRHDHITTCNQSQMTFVFCVLVQLMTPKQSTINLSNDHTQVTIVSPAE